MTSQTDLPTNFKYFLHIKKRIGENDKAKKMLNRFAYRYRLAKSFEGMRAPSVGKTLVGYDAILKVFLAYSAYDVLVTAALSFKLDNKPIVKSIAHNSVMNEDLIKRIRKSDKLKNFLHSNSTEDYQKDKLILAYERTNDIAPVCAAIRHIFAHGELTPSSIGINSVKERKLLIELANALLEYCDQLFTVCMELYKKKYN